jgi:5-methylthioadenosine/S-adenosylhomocysteine deaminase
MTKDLLIQNARLWPSVDDPVVEDGKILIRDGRIVKLGKFHVRADTVIDADGCLVMPGLIQGHVHLCQTLFRGLAEDRSLLAWLRGVVWPLEAAHDWTSLRASALLACAEMIKSGTTAFLSMETVRHTGAIFEAVAETGLMGVISHCFMDEDAGYPPLQNDLEDSLAECDVLLKKWGSHDSLRLGISPRFALSCSAENLQEEISYAREHGLLLHTHASEQIQEVKEVREKTSMGNIEFLNSIGLCGPDVCVAHCVHINERELRILSETDTRVLHCPTSNLKLGSGVAPVPDFLSAGLTVALGSDGAPCNNRLDLWNDMRMAGLVQKPLLGPQALPAKEIVRMATLGGAKAMGWEKEMGSLAVGKRANLILVDPKSVHVLPSDDPATNVVYTHSSSDVVMTIVNGNILYEDGRLTTIDEEALREDARKQRNVLMKRAGLGSERGVNSKK